MKELTPLVAEYRRLEAAAIALSGAVGSAASETGAAVRRRGPGRAPRFSERTRANDRIKTGHFESCPQTIRSPDQTPQPHTQRNRHARRASSLLRSGSAGNHHVRAGDVDGHERELPIQSSPRSREGRQDPKGWPGLVSEGELIRPHRTHSDLETRRRRPKPRTRSIMGFKSFALRPDSSPKAAGSTKAQLLIHTRSG